MKEKERYDLEQKKKQDEFALEAQRKKAEQELEFRKQAGLGSYIPRTDSQE